MAKRNSKPVEPDVLDAVPETGTEIIKEETATLRTFFSGALAFFAKATELERDAKAVLTRATALKAKHEGPNAKPITRDIDEKIQIELRGAKMKRKAIDDWWEITAIASRFHKRLVAGRERAGLMADEAAEITQALHNTYAREEQRKAREEEQKRRDAEEARQRQERDAELARAEAEAVRAEASSPMLSEREERFCESIMRYGLGPTDAARGVGYANPEVQGERLMGSAKIQKALDAKKTAAVLREQAAAKAAAPLSVVVERVVPNITKLAGSREVKRWKCTVTDADAFLAAVLDPKTRLTLGIPTDVVTFLQPKLNEYARSLHEKMNTWPGIRAEEDTSTS
jgi:hypothetical protein